MKRLLFILVLFSVIGAAAQTNPNPIAYKFRTIQEAVSGFADTNSIVQVSDTLSGGNFVVKRRAAGYRPNGGTILAMADSVSVLVRDISQAQAMNILWFQARPDYDTLTKAGTDISVALMLAANVGKNVFIPEGNYIIRHPALFRNMKNIRVFGTPQTNIYLPDDYASNALTPNTLRKAALDFYHVKNVEVDHINFFLNRTGMGITTNSNYIYAINIDYGVHTAVAGMGNLAYVHNVNVTNSPDVCIVARNYVTIRIEDDDLEDVTSGVSANYAETGKFIHNRIIGGVGKSANVSIGGQGLNLGDIVHLNVLNNIIDSVADSGVACYSAQFGTIAENYVENAGKDGLKVIFGGNTDTGFGKRMFIINNTVNKLWSSRPDGGAMIRLQPFGGDATLQGNHLYGGKKPGDVGGESGITIVGWGNTDHTLVGKRLDISHNIFWNLQTNCINLVSVKDFDINHNIATWKDSIATTPSFIVATNVGNGSISYNEAKNFTDSLNGTGINVSSFNAGDINNLASDNITVNYNTLHGFNFGITQLSADSTGFVDISNNNISKTLQAPILFSFNVGTDVFAHLNIDNNKLKNCAIASSAQGLIRLSHMERGKINNLSIRYNNALKESGYDLPLVKLDASGAPGTVDLMELKENNASGYTTLPVTIGLVNFTRTIGLSMAAPPTTGTWLKGDVITNSNPSLQAPNSWICTAGGSPGTWQVTGYGGEFYVGAGDPEGVTYAARGSLYMRNGLTGSTNLLFFKTTDSTFNTGWSHVMTELTGITSIANGGTNQTSFTKNAVPFFNGTSLASSHIYDSSGYIGFNVTTPVSKFANTTVNPLFNGTGVSSNASTWDGSGTGFAGATVNTIAGAGHSGKLVKIADTTNGSYIFGYAAGPYTRMYMLGDGTWYVGTVPLVTTATKYFNMVWDSAAKTMARVLIPASNWSRTGTTLSTATAGDNVNIGGTLNVGTSANVPSAIGQFASTTKGFLLPKMTTTQRDAIAGPVSGLFVYNTTTNTLDYYDGTVWGNAGGSATVHYWKLTNNTLSTVTPGNNVTVDGKLKIGVTPQGNISQSLITYGSDSALNIMSPGVFLAAQHPASTGSVPTISSNGTNVTATITGHDAAFQLTLTVSAGGASGTMCNITFNTVWNLVPKVIFSAATQSAGGTALAANATSTGGMTVTYNGTLPAGTYVYNFMCLQ